MPRSMSSCVVVSCVALDEVGLARASCPGRRPGGTGPCMNAPTLSRICAHSGSSFGSKTTHCGAAEEALLEEQRQCAGPARTSTRRRAGRRPRSVRAPQTTRAGDREGAQAVDARAG